MYSAYFPSMPNYAYCPMALPMMGLMTGANPYSYFGVQTRFCNNATFIDTRIQQCCNTVSADDLIMRMEAQCNAADYLQKRFNEADVLHKQRESTFFDKYVTSRNYTLYADNKPIDSFYTSEASKKRYTIYDLDRFIFPEDPIRDWVERKVAEINKKYAWVDKLDI